MRKLLSLFEVSICTIMRCGHSMISEGDNFEQWPNASAGNNVLCWHKKTEINREKRKTGDWESQSAGARLRKLYSLEVKIPYHVKEIPNRHWLDIIQSDYISWVSLKCINDVLQTFSYHCYSSILRPAIKVAIFLR